MVSATHYEFKRKNYKNTESVIHLSETHPKVKKLLCLLSIIHKVTFALLQTKVNNFEYAFHK